MINPIDAVKSGVSNWVDNQSPSKLGGIAFGALTLIGAALVAYAGSVSMEDVIEVANDVSNGDESSKVKDEKNTVIDITDEAEVVEEK